MTVKPEKALTWLQQDVNLMLPTLLKVGIKQGAVSGRKMPDKAFILGAGEQCLTSSESLLYLLSSGLVLQGNNCPQLCCGLSHRAQLHGAVRPQEGQEVRALVQLTARFNEHDGDQIVTVAIHVCHSSSQLTELQQTPCAEICGIVQPCQHLNNVLDSCQEVADSRIHIGCELCSLWHQNLCACFSSVHDGVFVRCLPSMLQY